MNDTKKRGKKEEIKERDREKTKNEKKLLCVSMGKRDKKIN